MSDIDYEMIVSIVNRGYSDYVINASREAGATGGTIVFARGTNSDTSKNSFMGIAIEPEKDIVLILVKTEDRKRIMQKICDNTTSMQQDGNGICFSLPVTNVVGLKEPRKNHLMDLMKKNIKNMVEKTKTNHKNDKNIDANGKLVDNQKETENHKTQKNNKTLNVNTKDSQTNKKQINSGKSSASKTAKQTNKSTINKTK